MDEPTKITNWQERLAPYALKTEGVLTNQYEALILGNGDVAAMVTMTSNEVLVTLGKNDAWDSSMPELAEDTVLRHDDLIRIEKEYGFSWELDFFEPHPPETINWDRQPPADMKIPVYESSPYKYDAHPSPKRIGYLRIEHPGMSETRVSARLDIATGVLRITYILATGQLTIDVMVHKGKNVLAAKVKQTGNVPWVRIAVGKLPDARNKTVPMAEVYSTAAQEGVVSQRMPEAYDVPEYHWHLAARFEGRSPVEPWTYELRQHCYLKDGEAVALSVGITTDRDGEEPALERAVALSKVHFDTALKESIAAWEEHWGRSSVTLEDKELESAWYRNLFGYACHVGQNAQAPGMNANVPTDDFSPWRGYYCWNHNVQKWYVTALPTNHPEWIETYARLIEQSMPLFEYQAQLIYGLDGVYCELASIPFTPPHRAFLNNKWGRALALTGWLGQPLWWHWEFTRDKEWLRTRAYPYLKRAAQFYWNYLEKYQDKDGDIFPSIRLEEPGWCKGFIGNRNVYTDLVMFRNAFEWAASAAEILGVDADLATQWREGIERVPEIEFGWGPDGEGWIALDKHWMTEPMSTFKIRTRDYTGETDDFKYRVSAARETRWGGVGFAVFPGERVVGDETEGLTPVIREMLSHADVANPKWSWVRPHAITSVLPRVRLGMVEDFEKIREIILAYRSASGQFSGVEISNGQYPALHSRGDVPPLTNAATWRLNENEYLGVEATTEMLLQSQGGVIRLFPFASVLPTASFEGLRARGGFMVAASCAAGVLTQATIESLAGEVCRIRWDGEALPVVEELTASGAKRNVAVERGERTISFATQAGATYRVGQA